jgi:hypothetical protein
MKVRHSPRKGEATEKAAQLRSDLELTIADADAAERKEAILQTLDEERAGVELRMRAAERLGEKTWRTPLTNSMGTFIVERPGTEVAEQCRKRLRAIDAEIVRVEAEGPPIERTAEPAAAPTVAPDAVESEADVQRRKSYVAALRVERHEVEARIARAKKLGEDPCRRVEQLKAIDAELTRSADAA